MTILFFSRLFYPHIGGVERHVLEIGKRLVKKGHKVTVITEEYQSKESSAKTTGEVDGIKVHRINVGRENLIKKFRIWWWLWQHREIIKNADIVHCHDVFFWYLPFRFLYPNKKVYTTFHGYETKFPPSKKAILVRKISERLSNGSICIGEYVKKWYGASSKYVTYGGVNIHNYHATVRGNYAKGVKILFIGRLEEDVGIPIYLRTLEILKRRGVRFTFEACGDGSLRGEVERYGMVYGFVKDMDKYIERSEFVFTSSYLSVLEAISRGKIVFSVFQNKLKEDYLKMSPFAKWIVIKSSAKDLADKIFYFIKHQEEKEKIANTAFEWVKTQTWEKIVSVYLNLWHFNDLNH